MHTQGKNLTATVNSIKISYNDDGPENAPVIIFIHGFPFNKSMWKGQVASLSDTYRVIAYDIRGHGETETGDVDFSIDLFASDLLGLMDFLNIQKATLCGLSMGGYIALRAIEDHPQHFDALILSDTQCVADTPEAKEKRMKTIESIKEHGVMKFADDSLKNLFTADAFTSKQDSVAAIKAMILNTSNQSLSKTLHALANRKETCTGLVNISVPTLIMVGKEDPITPVAAAEFMHQHIQGSSFHIVQQAAHLPNLENPEDFDFQLKLFLHRFAKSPVNINTILVD